MNKIVVRFDPIVCGLLKLKPGEQRKPAFEKDIVRGEVEDDDGRLVVKLVNITNKVIELKNDECIARAELSNR